MNPSAAPPPVATAAQRLFLAWLRDCQTEVDAFSRHHAESNGDRPPTPEQALAACPRLLDSPEVALFFLDRRQVGA